MEWPPSDPNTLALIVAGIGFAGGLAGALVGFVGTWWATRQQIDRQERDVRRGTYGDYLSVALTLQGIQTRQARAYDTHADCEVRLLGYRAEQASMTDPEDRAQVQKVLDHLSRQAADALSDWESLNTEFRTMFDQFLFMSHRLKIEAHPVMHSLGMQFYQDLGMQLSAHDPAIREQARAHFDGNLIAFAELARADTRAPGAGSWRAARKKYERLFSEVETSPSEGPTPLL